MNPVREQAEYLLTKGFFTLLRFCPAPVIYGLCRGVAALFYALAAKRRSITLRNLSLAFPELTAKERLKIARKAYDHFGQMIAESAMVLSGKINREQLIAMVDGSEMPRLLELERNSDKGILAITGHLGNFELMSHYTGTQSIRQGNVVARKGSNKLIDARIVTPMRESFGNHVIYKHRALPNVARALKRGEHVGLLIDIKSNRKEGVPVTFFGKETVAIKSSAYLQIKLKPLVVPLAMVRTAPRRYKLIAGEPIEWIDNGKPLDEQIKELTQIHQASLEKLIRETPEQWLWMHNRWKI
ncbi:MAG: lysophospholipid acyltransferase family protein [Verrucomicrobia bacterium]|nr:lysophospholipid acyltransferase family protein [Verrucomicrobiota bacterium]